MPEQKAYDLAVLVEKIKGRGLDLAEESVKLVVEELFNWVSDSAKISATPYDDMALVVLPQIQKVVLGLVDKINGKEG